MKRLRPKAIAAGAFGLLIAATQAVGQAPPAPPTTEIVQPGDGAAVSLRVQWTDRPTSADVEKLRPPGFRDAAQVVLRCRLNEPGDAADGRLHSCAPQSESPGGHGFAAAALSLAGRFHIDPATYSGPPERAQIAVPIRWRALTPPVPARPAAFSGSVTGLDLIASPTYLAQPTADQVRAAQPPGLAGRVVMECTVALDTTVKDCRILEESPLGVGFGAGAISLAPLYRVAPMTDKDGRPKEAVVRLAMNFTPK